MVIQTSDGVSAHLVPSEIRSAESGEQDLQRRTRGSAAILEFRGVKIGSSAACPDAVRDSVSARTASAYCRTHIPGFIHFDHQARAMQPSSMSLKSPNQ